MADRKITCPLPGSGWWLLLGDKEQRVLIPIIKIPVFAQAVLFLKIERVGYMSKCCNEPATEAEYLVSHPNPGAIDCTVDDATTSRKAGYYYKALMV